MIMTDEQKIIEKNQAKRILENDKKYMMIREYCFNKFPYIDIKQKNGKFQFAQKANWDIITNDKNIINNRGEKFIKNFIKFKKLFGI